MSNTPSTMKDLIIQSIETDPKLQSEFKNLVIDAIGICEHEDATKTLGNFIRNWFLEQIDYREISCVSTPIYPRETESTKKVEQLFLKLLRFNLAAVKDEEWWAIATHYLNKYKKEKASAS